MRWLLVSALVWLAACAGPWRTVGPADFPFHATDHPFFDVHWRLERSARGVLAVGLVEAARQAGVSDVTLELRGVDGGDRVVSRSLGTTYGGALLFLGDTRPFTVRLRPTGQEQRFELRVWGFSWEFGRGGRGARR
jgi:hypothetical protein